MRLVADSLYIVYRQSPLGSIDLSFQALSGRPKFTVRRHNFNKDSLLRAGDRIHPEIARNCSERGGGSDGLVDHEAEGLEGVCEPGM